MSTAPSDPGSPHAAAGAEIELRRDGASAVVTEAGAGLRSWRVEGRELLDTFAAGAPADSYRGKLLAPWPNRIRDGRYAFGGVEHRTPVSEPGRGTALHGLVLEAPFAVPARTPDAVTLGHVLQARPGYPFTLRLEVVYALDRSRLSVTVRATNASPAPAPFGAGLHPYLAAAGGRADDCLLEIPAATRVPVDDRMLPTGPPVPVAGTDLDFTRVRRVGDRRLDTCFGDLRRDGDGRARVRLVPPAGPEITLAMDERFGFVHVYTADAVTDPGRARASIALEPVTCAPDAFNSGAGLAVIEPGATFTAACALSAGRRRDVPGLR